MAKLNSKKTINNAFTTKKKFDRINSCKHIKQILLYFNQISLLSSFQSTFKPAAIEDVDIDDAIPDSDDLILPINEVSF